MAPIRRAPLSTLVSALVFLVLAPAATTTTTRVDHDVVIVGGGIVGLSAAAALSRRRSDDDGKGVRVRVIERSSALRPVGALLGLFPNGIAALRSIGPEVCRGVLDDAIPVRGAIVKEVRCGEVAAVRERKLGGKRSSGGMLLVWYLLQRRLASALPDGTLRLGEVFLGYDVDDASGLVSVTVADRESGETKLVTCRALVGADGIRSAVRRRMLGRDANLRYHRRVMYRAALDVDEVDARLVPPRGYRTSYACGEIGKCFVVGEAAEGILTITATVIREAPPEEGLESSEPRCIKDRMRRIFSNYPAEVRRIIDQVDDSAIHEDAVHDIDLPDRWSSGPVVLCGDAVHAMTPALGQGGNMGLEDSAELALVLGPLLDDLTHGDGIDTTIGDISAIKRGQERIERTLEEFWRRRSVRVEEVHRISREEAEYKNQSNGQDRSPLRWRNVEFYEWLHAWEPSL